MSISFLDAAQAELDSTIDYYEDQRSGLGFQFANEVERTLERINHFPEAGSLLSSRVRRCMVNRFPYSVLYEVRGKLLLIVAVQNHHRAPESWRSRVK